MPLIKKNFRFNIFNKIFTDEGLTKKASLNAIAAALDYGVRLIVGFLIQPILVSGLGSFYYGVWQILLRFVGYITPASGRPAQALKMTLANHQTTAIDEEKRRFVGSSLVVWAIFVPIMATLGGLLIWFIPFWIKSPEQYYSVIRLTTSILVFSLIISNLASIPQSTLEGENLGYKRMGLSAFLVVVGGGLTWLAVRFNTGLIGIATASLTVTLLTGGFYIWLVRDYSKWFGISRPSFKEVRQFLGLSWWFMAWNLIMSLMTASDVVILGILLSVETVTDYSLSKYVPETLISIVAIIAFGIAPGLGGIIGSGKLEKASQIRGEIMSITWLIVTTIGATILLWNRQFISLWVEPQHYVGSIPNLLIVLTVMQFVFIRNDGNVIDLSLRLKQKVIMGGISVVLSLGLAAVLVGYFKLGIVGLCLGIITGRIILSIGYPVLVGQLLNISFISQLKSAIRPVVITILIFILATNLDLFVFSNKKFNLNGWIGLGVEVGVTFLILIASAFFAGLTRNQRNTIIHRLRIVMKLSSQ